MVYLNSELTIFLIFFLKVVFHFYAIKNHNDIKLNYINVTIIPDIINITYSNGMCHTPNFMNFIAF